MKLVGAIKQSANGRVIESFEGNRYFPNELRAKKIGDESVVFNSGHISEEERKGRWKVI